MAPLDIEEFNSWESLTAYRQQWNDLVDQQQLGPAHEFSWLETVWNVNRANRELLVILFSDSDGVAGIASFVKETEKRRGLLVQILKPLAWFHSLHGTQLIFARDPQLLLNTLFEYLNKKHNDWVLWFTQYKRGEEQESMFASALQQRGYPFESHAGVRSPYLRIEETWDEKMKTLQPRFRTALRSREKRLREKGPFELRFLDSADEWQAGLDAIREIEGDSWKVAAGSAITVQDFQWRFYCRYAPLAAKCGTLRIPVLYLDGEPLAYDYAIYDRGIYYLLKTSYRQKWQEMYPGFVLRKLMVEWAYSQCATEIDFLGKDEDWKMKWTSTVREHTEFYTFNRNWSALYLRGMRRIGSLLQHKG